MINLLSFNPQQQIVIRRGISDFIFCLTFVLSGYYVIALPLPLFNTAESRLIFTLLSGTDVISQHSCSW
jgi:hypothetical protein